MANKKEKTMEEMKAELMHEMQTILGQAGLDVNAIRNLKALALQKMDKQHHMRLWRSYKTDIMDSMGHKVDEIVLWVQTGWLVKEQIDRYFQKGFKIEPPESATFPYGYKAAVTNLNTMKTQYVPALELFPGRKEAPKHVGHIYKPDGKMTIKEAKDKLSKEAFAEWAKQYLDVNLDNIAKTKDKK